MLIALAMPVGLIFESPARASGRVFHFVCPLESLIVHLRVVSAPECLRPTWQYGRAPVLLKEYLDYFCGESMIPHMKDNE